MPLGSAVLVMVSGAGLIVIVSPVVDAVWCTGRVASVAVIVTETGFTVGVVGVPLITPLFKLIDRPAGRPVAGNVYGTAPPLTVCEGALYAVPTTPFGNGLLVIVTPVGAMVSVNPVVDAVWCVGRVESVTVIVTETGFTVAVVGVPVIAPVPGLIERPAGRP